MFVPDTRDHLWANADLDSGSPVLALSERAAWCRADHGRPAAFEKNKKTLCELLDKMLYELLQQRLQARFLTAFVLAAPMSPKPLVRNYLYLHVFDWLKRQKGRSDEAFSSRFGACFPILQELVLLGLTDVWSATRKSCAQRLSSMGPLLTNPQLGALFTAVLDRYRAAESMDKDQWREKEGCLLGLTMLLKLYQPAQVGLLLHFYITRIPHFTPIPHLTRSCSAHHALQRGSRGLEQGAKR